MNTLVFILQLMLTFGWFYQTSEAFTPWMKPQGDTSIPNTRRTKFKVTRKTVEIPGEAPSPPPLFLDLNEARRAQKYFFGDRAPSPLSQGLDDRPLPPAPLSEDLDPTLTLSLNFFHLIFFKC